ncbi:hypothetical protein V6Z12_A01G158700 [Gossypium hirsutum]
MANLLENILHLENGFQDTSKMTCNLGKMSYRFLFSKTFSISFIQAIHTTISSFSGKALF